MKQKRKARRHHDKKLSPPVICIHCGEPYTREQSLSHARYFHRDKFFEYVTPKIVEPELYHFINPRR